MDNMLWKKIDKLFNSMHNVFSRQKEILFSGMPTVFNMPNEISISGFNKQGRDHDTMLDKVLRICRKANLKPIKDKCLFRCTRIPFFCEIIFWPGVNPDPKTLQTLTGMLLLKIKKELHLFLGILHYQSEFLPVTVGVSAPMQKLSSVKNDWEWYRMYQHL